MAAKKREDGVRVRLVPDGLELLPSKEHLPLVAGAMHYWRHHPSAWAPCLDAMKAMGLRVVDVYVPWGIHEKEPKRFDFGEHDPRLDLERFLGMVKDRGLYAVARPGPHINAELTYFGLPERVVWDRACQARTPRDNPVMLPMVPVAFPVPSYASEPFHEEVEEWFAACGPILARSLYPEGPVVLVQIDNEGALYFRDGAYDQDYHPDSIALFRTFLREKYKRPSVLRAAWGDAEVTFATAVPPVRFDAAVVSELARHLDWVEYQEYLLATSMERMAHALVASGVRGVPTMHNFPLGEAATPLNASRIGDVIDLVALDYYHHATPEEHAVLVRRTTELASRCEGMGHPPYGAEVGAGFPPFFAPHDEKDSVYTLCAALAYGLRGFNLYMAVERDRWIGAPIDPYGQPRRLADTYKALFAALEANGFYQLKRRAPVRLVMPRSIRRLARATHAFGAATPALFNVLGKGFHESCFENPFTDDVDSARERAPTLVAESFLRAFERALLARGVPFAYAAGEALTESTYGTSWIICATAGGLKADVFGQLRARAQKGCVVTIGPEVPTRDGSFRALTKPHDVTGLELETLAEEARADALVARRIEELKLPTYPVDPEDVQVSVLEDDEGRARLVFVMNPLPSTTTARLSVGTAQRLDEVFPGEGVLARSGGGFDVAVAGRSVRIFSVS